MNGASETRQIARAELHAGLKLTKCRQCGCMRETLEAIHEGAITGETEAREFADQAASWLAQMAPVAYACLGCAHCFAAVALNALTEAGTIHASGLTCAFATTDQRWPAVAGEYAATCTGANCPVAVSTLASTGLAHELARRQPSGLCIVGKTETENIGIDKVVKNVVANPTIHYLIVAGRDPEGHRSGQTLVALANNGVDEHMRVVGSLGKRPILRNVTQAEVEVFRNQVKVVDLIGCEDAERIVAAIEELTAATTSTTAACDCGQACTTAERAATLSPEVMVARPAELVEMDRAGYFVIILDVRRKIIVAEHYAYDNQIQHVLEGTTSRDIYSTIIDAGWVTQFSHAAYLGKELATAELSLRYGLPYVQDTT